MMRLKTLITSGIQSWLGEWDRAVVAAAGGLLLAAAFPKIGVEGFAWLAPGIILASGAGARGGTAFRAGYVAGMVFFLTALYWLLYIPVPVAPIVGWILLAAFLSLFPATWVWLCWKMFPGNAPTPEAAVLHSGRFASLRHSLGTVLLAGWRGRLGWSILCAALWVAWEMVQARIFTGFPWNLLGASQYTMLPLIQVSSITGVYGVSFLVAWFSCGLLGAVAVLMHQPARRSGALAEVFIPLVVVVVAMSWGARRMLAPAQPESNITVGLIQPSIPQTTIWDPKQAAQRFRQVVELSERALTESKPQLLVWPEAAVPSLILWDRDPIYEGRSMYEAVADLARRHNVWLIIGADDAEPRGNGSQEADYYNSSFLVTPQGRIAAKYRKQQLVIFGEYVPLSRWLPFLKDFTQVYGEFTRGKGPVSFPLGDTGVKTSVLICFEDVFPHLARLFVEPDTDFLVNLTNNGWFGESAAQWQHAANAVFRAVENGLPLVRAANNGLSCWVDAHGRLHDVYFENSSNVYQAGYKTVEVPVSARQAPPATFYRRHGDWFGWACVGIAGLAALQAFLSPRWRRSPARHDLKVNQV